MRFFVEIHVLFPEIMRFESVTLFIKTPCIMVEGEMDGALSWPARHDSHGRVMRMREKRTRPFDGGACCGVRTMIAAN